MSHPLPTGKFTITINKFRPLGGVFPISATLTPDPENPPDIVMRDGHIFIKNSKPVRLIFKMPNQPSDPGYIFLGVAFASNSANPTVGLHTFPDIAITTVDNGTSRDMSVTDQPQPVGVQRYDYLLLVQNVATAEVGLIDPQLTNDND